MTATRTHRPGDAGDRAIAEDFLFGEARLLDEGRWDDWLGLFAEDGMYWVPLARGQTDAIDHVSLFHEDALMREVRARRLQDAHAWSRQPAARTARLVGNVQVLDPLGGADLVVTSTFHLLEWHRDRHRMLGGFYTHHLRMRADGPRILLKRVDLVDCDGTHDILEGFL